MRYAPIVLSLLGSMFATAVAADPDPVEIRHAVDLGLSWIHNHPCTPEDGGLPDIIDGGVTFLVLSRLAAEPEERERFRAAMCNRLSLLESLPAFRDWVASPDKPLIDHYHLVLAAHLMDLSGSPSSQRAAIIRAAHAALVSSPYGHPTVRLTIGALLGHMGMSVDLRALRERGLVARLAGGAADPLPPADSPVARRMVGMPVYALVHELIALRDFGRVPASPWLERRLPAAVRLLEAAFDWARAEGEFDLLAELIVVFRLLELPVSVDVEGALAELIDSQRDDGSWGDSATTTRGNPRRHTVMTATTALWSYRSRTAGASDAITETP